MFVYTSSSTSAFYSLTYTDTERGQIEWTWNVVSYYDYVFGWESALVFLAACPQSRERWHWRLDLNFCPASWRRQPPPPTTTGPLWAAATATFLVYIDRSSASQQGIYNTKKIRRETVRRWRLFLFTFNWVIYDHSNNLSKLQQCQSNPPTQSDPRWSYFCGIWATLNGIRQKLFNALLITTTIYTSIYMKTENEDVRKRMTMKIDASPLGTYICRLTGRSDFDKHSVCTYVPFRGEQITIVFVILAVRP